MMKKIIKISVLLFLAISLHAKEKELSSLDGQKDKLNVVGIHFTENKGQVHDQNYKPRPDILFGAMTGNMAFHLRTTGVSYQLYRVDEYKDIKDEFTKEKRKEIVNQTIYRIDLDWVNANRNYTKTTDQTLEGYSNYYTEGCSNGGALYIRSYTGVTLHNLYEGISLHYYEKDGALKHDYIVAPNTDYKQIQLNIKGASVSVNSDGTLLLTTPLGKIEEGAPIVYQDGKQLKAKWVLKNSTISFDIENYNPNLELIIDPVTRLWGTYYGDASNEYGTSCITDPIGNVYLAGYSTSSTGTVIATVGAHQTFYGGGVYDAIFVKFNSAGVRQWSTYYGDTSNDFAESCSTDALGNAYLAGYAVLGSGTVIATPGAHQTVYGGGAYDAFLVKFNSLGIRQWGTYYGGTSIDIGYSCCTDDFGNVYLAGKSESSSSAAIATTGAHQTSFNGISDAFLVKFNSSGTRQWGTYYGGSGNDVGRNCNADLLGNVYMTGQTTSSVGIIMATAGSHQSSYGGTLDAFLVKFDGFGSRQWGTYYGGALSEIGFKCSIDNSGNVFMAGYTESSTTASISSALAHQSVFGGGSYDAFLAKFNSSGIRQWGTYYGGTSADFGISCTNDVSGNVYLSGHTSTSTGTVIATMGAHQTVLGGSSDAFLVKFNSSGIRQWGTYYGGISSDGGYSCSSDAFGNVYLAGQTVSSIGTVIASSGAHQTVFGGGASDVYLAKFNDCLPLTPSAVTTPTICAGSNISFIANVSSTVVPTYNWAGPSSFTSNIQNPSIVSASVTNTGTYTLSVTYDGCVETTTVNVVVYVCTGINDVNRSSSEVEVYPNPNNGLFNLQASLETEITILDILGKVILSKKISEGTHQLNLSEQANGIYFLKVESGAQIKTIKLIKE